ncbi:tRNA1(Val) (adenine(37)-N6)-methyltransferase [Maridesulfovibrio salexigens]|uniref:Methyltransferase type 11 n=1 Tax=Maridesulfovibrio salexigens (strain ATCC 14822 / DSM 2638 / NCIMB 8403 / VKM B-1763) TaxID=526222 RepID=C6BUY0_MARSD|nr:methyltransferase [Maridesulfovibrio salexigens]ACS78117.1 Methyltransferase type 11 [Maridesulfovibrio salexigens DSM 2638]
MFEEIRNYFPRGLVQPQSGFRFSTDSLLISSFVSVPSQARVLDLGTGSGVIPLGIMLRHPDKGLNITGLEINSDMVAAAEENVQKLGFAEEIGIVQGNVCTPDFAPAGSYDLVVSNPPYRSEGRGKACPDEDRNKARFEIDCDLDAFVATASRMVRNRGRVCFVFLAERLTELIDSFTRHKLEPKRMKFIHGRIDSPSKVVMLEAVKGGKPGLILEPPVILFERDNSLTPSSIEYCPFIAK